MKKIWLALALLGCAALHAAEPGAEAIVIYNSRMPESKNVAQYYAERRHVPSSQIFGLDLPTDENMTRAEFRNLLQKPLAARLESKNIWQIAPQEIQATNGKPRHVVRKVVRSGIRYAVLVY